MALFFLYYWRKIKNGVDKVANLLSIKHPRLSTLVQQGNPILNHIALYNFVE
jgi:hypothetical protein